MISKKLASFLLFSCALFGLNSTATAQSNSGKNAQSGDLEIEETSEKKENPLATAKNQALQWARSLPQAAASEGASAGLDGGALVYVAASYVYCVRKLGNCAFILDAVLETDVLGARSRGDSKCPVSGKFWRAWLDNDMESRLKIDLPIGFFNTVTSFNQKERPKYVRCEDAVTKALKDPKHAQNVAGSLKKTQALFEEIDAKGIDLLGTVGISLDSKTAAKGKSR